MIYDPGFVPKPSGLNEQKEVIENLLSLWKYDESNFCVECMLRKPLRSKHCRRCNRCAARHDQLSALARAPPPLPRSPVSR